MILEAFVSVLVLILSLCSLGILMTTSTHEYQELRVEAAKNNERRSHK